MAAPCVISQPITTVPIVTPNTPLISVSTQVEVADVASGESRASLVCLASLRAARFEEDTRAPVDVVAVLDRSGSMQGEKMATLHRTVELIIAHLNVADRLAIVAYDDKVSTPLPLCAMNPKGKDRARAALRQVTPRGATNLSGALLAALDVLEDNVCVHDAAAPPKPNKVSSVLLLTDGLANHGIINPDKLLRMAANRLQEMGSPPSLYSFGYGSENDAALLTALAAKGNGTYYFCETVDSIPLAFADCLGGLMSVVGQSISLSIAASPGVAIRSVSASFPTTEVRAGAEYTVRVGDLFSEEEKDILVDVALSPVADALPAQPLLHFTVKYFDVINCKTTWAEAVVSVSRPRVAAKQVTISETIDFHRNRMRTADALDAARALGDQGQFAQANDMLRSCMSSVAQSRSAPQSAVLVADMDACRTTLNAHSYGAQGKKLSALSHQHRVQRSAGAGEGAAAYETRAKGRTKGAFAKAFRK